MIKSLITLLLLAPILVSCTTTSEKTSKAYRTYRGIQKSHLVQNGEISYIDKGQGEAILLLHGVPTSGWLYRKMIDGLVSQGYRVIVPDMLGYGSSANPKGYEIYSAKKQAERIVALMDHLKIKKWNHVFHDVGGTWTWELMQDHEHRVNKLIMLNAIALEEGFHPPVRMEPGLTAKAAMWSYRNGITTHFLLNRLFEVGVKNPDLISKADRAGYAIPLREGKTNGIYYFFTQTCNHSPDYTQVIQKVKTPISVIWGKHDSMLQWTPQASKISQPMNLSESDIHLIDAKHFIQEEEPELVNRLIIKFLRK